MRILSSLAIATMAMLPGNALADAPAWQLRPNAMVDGAGILLSTVVESVPAGLGPVRLGNPPAAGQSVTYTRAQINELLSQVDSTLITTNWTGAPKIKITRRCRTLTDLEVKDLVTTALQKNYVKDRGELELRLTNPWAPVAIPDDPVSVRILDLPSAGVTPSFIIRFELVTGVETIGQWQLPLTARIWRDVWVAAGKIPRGAVVRDAELGQERRDVLSLRDAVVRLNPDDTSMEFSENLTAGTPLSSRALRPRTVVFRGHVLDAIVQEGSLVISVKVEALENGAPGQTVRVRNINSKREFRGKVQNEETILVSL